MISFSNDRGQTWSPIDGQIKPLVEWAQGTGQTNTLPREELFRLFQRLRDFHITQLRVDRTDPNTWYGLVETGVVVSHDAGQNWTVANTGLDIPRPQTLWTPRHAKSLMTGTPAGMYLSNDRAATWHDTPLILQHQGAFREEIGGAGYMTAYWMGRYHGFITKKQAEKRWWVE